MLDGVYYMKNILNLCFPSGLNKLSNLCLGYFRHHHWLLADCHFKAVIKESSRMKLSSYCRFPLDLQLTLK